MKKSFLKGASIFLASVLTVGMCSAYSVNAKAKFSLPRKTYARIEELVKEYDVEKIVLGLPKNMNNTVGERGEDTLSFRDALVRRTGLEVILWDERLTTVASEKVLMESGVRRENRKKVIDQIAASMILQGYLDSL